VAEQSVRAERMSAFGLFDTILPSTLTPRALADAVQRQVLGTGEPAVREFVDMEALPRICKLMDQMWRPALQTAAAAGQLSVRL
jgi:predicted glycosyltransferase